MKMKDGACGEGKCGSAMMKTNEDKTVEGKCAGNKPMPKKDDKAMPFWSIFIQLGAENPKAEMRLCSVKRQLKVYGHSQ